MEQPPSKHPKLDIKEIKPIGATFERLPNEIVEISIKMALKKLALWKHIGALCEI